MLFPAASNSRLLRIASLLVSVLLGLSGAISSLAAATLSFTYSLEEAATTSAGVYRPDGTLIRTLWRRNAEESGAHTAVWDGVTDQGSTASPGNYTIRVAAHHVNYVWDGAIGNTSTAATGPTVHKASNPIRDITITGTDAFYITGYSENTYNFRHFRTTDPQRLNDRWTWWLSSYSNTVVNHTSTIYDRDWNATDSDGTWVYFASPDSANPAQLSNSNHPGFVVASLVSDHSLARFTQGQVIATNDTDRYPNGIYVGTQPGLSGLAVQRTGNLLAVAVKPDNKVYFFNKRTGVPTGSLSVATPGALAFNPEGDLWVISGTSLLRFASGASQTPSTTVTGLKEPLDIAVHPVDSSVAVLDAGSSQQVKCYSKTGAPLWTLGQAGGYAANGPAVTNDKFLFNERDRAASGCLTFGPDGSLWLGDPGNRRLLHFDAARTFIEQVMFQTCSYSTGVDPTNPSRVFCDFLEFQVDYHQPARQSWTLVRNWAANLPREYFGLDQGIRQVTTLSNGRTYGVVSKMNQAQREIVELTNTGLRLTPLRLANSGDHTGKIEFFAPDGAIRRADLFDGSAANPAGTRTVFEEKSITGFSASGDPQWGPWRLLATASAENIDPVNRCCSFGDFNIPVTSSGMILALDSTKTPSWHLGGVQIGGQEWSWRGAPTVTNNVPIDGRGSFSIGDNVQYAGNSVFATGRHVFYGYHGEFWNNAQAGQFMHFLENGLFIGQFGEPSAGHEPFEGAIPGFAGNSAFSVFVSVGSELYLWANDESQHGPQRWHISGTRTIREATGSGALGQTAPVILTLPAATFPTNLSIVPGNQRASLTWSPVAGASGYTVKTSTAPAGPWSIVASGVQGTGHTLTGLVNGRTLHVTVSATTATGDGPDAAPVMATPFDSSAFPIEKAGVHTQMGNLPDVLELDSAAPSSGKPALRGLNRLLGDLSLPEVGRRGYQIFRWNDTTLADATNFPGQSPVISQTGWKEDRFLGWSWKIGGATGSNRGIFVNSTAAPGILQIDPGSPGDHYLTVVVPSQFRNRQRFAVRLHPAGQPDAGAEYSFDDQQSINRMLQFRFRGPVTLSVTRLEGEIGIQGIFLDEVPAIPAATTGFQLWQQQNFANPNDPQTAPQADPDGDGVANLIEYLTGTHPANSTLTRKPGTDFLPVGSDEYLTLRFVQSRSAVATCQVGVSSDLVHWTLIDPADPRYLVSRTTDSPGIGLDTVTVRDVLPTSNSSRFMRLVVSAP